MLDLKFIQENQDLIKQNIKNRNLEIDVDKLVALGEEKNTLLQKVEKFRAERNQKSKSKPTEEEIVAIRKMGEELNMLETSLKSKNEELEELLMKIPNIVHESVPAGKDETENKIIKTWGEPKKFTFTPKEHWELGEKLDVINTAKAGEVSGPRFAYIKGRLALLEFALVQFVFSSLTDESVLQQIIDKNNLKVSSKPFIPVIPPVFIKPEVMQQMGRLEPKEERYHIVSDDQYLVGSAEHTLGPMHMNEILKSTDLPVRYIGFSTAFRREAGSYGKDTKGIFRLHQFDKMEMESFALPETSLEEQDFIMAIQEYLMQSLGIPYRLVLKCTGDMGLPDFREVDVEAWMPGQGKYRETHTSDLMTDFQSRRLNIRYKTESGKTEFVHMNDATALAMSRAPVAIMENYQLEDGHISVPEVLRKYTGFDII
jgi:seryl-tRNA synthetase